MNTKITNPALLISIILAGGVALAAQEPMKTTEALTDQGTNGDVFMSSPAPYTTSGVLLQAKPSWPSIAAKTGTSDASSRFSIFNSADTELFNVRSNGNIGLRGAVPSAWHPILSPAIEHTNTSINFGPGLPILLNSNSFYTVSAGWVYKSAERAAHYYTDIGAHAWRVAPAGTPGAPVPWISAMYIANSGNVGMGTMTPTAKVHVTGGPIPLQVYAANSNGFGIVFRDLLATENYGSGVLMDMQGNSMVRVSNLQIGRLGSPEINSTGLPLTLNNSTAQDVVMGDAAYSTRLQVRGTGTSTFGGSISVTGNVTATGTIAAKYQDVAEWVPATSDMMPGTVVVLNPEKSNEVTASSSEYDVRVAGVVSELPGLILGESGDSKEQIATTGRVRVHVDASHAPIRVGDLLVTSSKPGRAMRSDAVEIQGRRFHQPGTIVGKALEPLASGEGDILVLLSLQ